MHLQNENLYIFFVVDNVCLVDINYMLTELSAQTLGKLRIFNYYYYYFHYYHDEMVLYIMHNWRELYLEEQS